MNRWSRNGGFTLLIEIIVGVTLVILFNSNFASAIEEVNIPDLQGVVEETNNATNYKSINDSKSSIGDNQDVSFNTNNLSSNAGHSENPQIVTNGKYVYILWLDDTAGNRDVYFKMSADNGTTFGDTINVSHNAGGSLNPTIVVTKSSGTVYMVWEHIPGGNGQIYFARSTDNGATFEKPVNLGNNTGLNGFPQVALSEDGTKVYAIWHDMINGVTLRRSTDSGTTFEKPVSLSDKDAEALNPQIFVSNNIAYVIWQSNPQGRNGEIVFTRSTDNGATFEKPVSLTGNEGHTKVNFNGTTQKSDSNKQNNLTLTYSPRFVLVPGNKEVYVVWYRGFNTLFRGNYYLLNDIFFTRSTDNGATFEKPVSLTNYYVWPKDSDNEGSFEKPVSLSGYSGWDPNLEIAASKFNYVYVTWQSNPQGRNGEIVFTRSTDNGATFEKPITVSDRNGNSVGPKIAVSDDNQVYVAWQSNPQGRNGEIVFTRSTDNGATFEKPITVSDRNGNSVGPQIGNSPNNSVYLAWTNNATGNEEINFLKAQPSNKSLKNSIFTYNHANLSNNSDMHLQTKNPKKIALIERTFTDAAYDKALYLFYNIKRDKDDNLSNITEYTNLLSSKVVKQYSILPEFEVILNHLKWLTPESNITVLTDSDAHDTSSIFMDNGTVKYDIILVGHNEYVTQQEYDNLKRFVANGGILILLDGNVFYAEVKYDKKDNTITLVKGHRWEFDGTFASKSVDERWANETTTWVGSNYCECWGTDNIRFANNPFGVRHNEEQFITNPDSKIILDYQAYDVGKSEFLPKDFKIATYEMNYKKGKVITMGLYTDDLLFFNDKFKRFFDSLLFYNGLQVKNPLN
jgi:N,N-dimethylformamidase beta subunit-like protein/BNR repeat protein